MQDFYQRCIKRWSAPRYALDARFVDLTLLLDQGADAQGQRWQAKHDSFQTLQQVLAATPDPVVLLGAPGCGKSTLLRHFELENAQAGLQALEVDAIVTPRLTFFIPLNEFKGKQSGDPPPQPMQWLSERWAQRHPELPELPELLQSGRMTLLLDAFNEIPYRSQDVIQLWKDFLADLSSGNEKPRVIFSCRSLDYSAPLSGDDNPVHQVRIESLSDDKVREFLLQYSPDHGEALWAKLENSLQLPLFRSPYFLKMLIDESDAGEIPSGRTELFTAFVRRLLRREIEKGNALFQAGELLHSRDIQRLIQTQRGKTPWELPKRGILLPKLSLLAYRMQRQNNAQESGQVKIDYDQALELLDHPSNEEILKAGIAMDVLEQDLEEDQVYYIHQLVQEYFAAQQLAENPEPQLASQEWRGNRVSPNLAETLKTLPDSEPLPPLDTTGWEETLLLASAMQQNPDSLITELMSANLPLAARCAAQPDVPVSDALKQQLQLSLLERTQNPKADLRARIAAGFALGELGDPRFTSGQGSDGKFLLPPMIAIPSGEYPIGSDEGFYEDEAPAHPVQLEAFQIGQFSLTNAEWDLFIKAGGYEDPRWWQGAAAQAWQSGKNTDAGPKQQWREDRKYFQDNFESIREWLRDGKITTQQADNWELIAKWSKDEFDDWLNKQLRGGKLREPAFWFDDAFNQEAQPVVGICRHEARAYCSWLSVQSGQFFRLPTEAEWEAAARGMTARRFAYGNNFDNSLANTFETHIRKTTPIGVFPGGNTPEGLQDMTGNVWEWTDSLLLDYPFKAEHDRETVKTANAPRVVRGGSWSGLQDCARAAYRGSNRPGYRYS